MRLLLLNKPFRVLTRFSRADARATLADHVAVADVYPAGRLDYDSEGLVLLTDDGRLQAGITDPRHALAKTYWAQVEGQPTAAQIAHLARGVALADGTTRPAGACLIDPPPGLWPREPPIRHRARIPTAWIELTLHEGRNRQARRMTAAVGLPTLRLVRSSIGPLSLQGLAPGEVRDALSVELDALWAALRGVNAPRSARSASRPRAPVRS